MGKYLNNQVASEAVRILIVLLLFCLITRVWPLVFLVIPGILIAALRLLFISVKKEAAASESVPVNAAAPQKIPRQNTEQDIVLTAFGILQKRVTEQVTARYPAARWIWETPNVMKRFSEGFPLTIMLNNAGGFRKAAVQVHNLQFSGLLYETVDPKKLKKPVTERDDEDISSDDASGAGHTDYSMFAYEWVDKNFMNINDSYNAAVTAGNSKMLIPSDVLPVRGSWVNICLELNRIGFPEAVATDGGIQVTLSQ